MAKYTVDSDWDYDLLEELDFKISEISRKVEELKVGNLAFLSLKVERIQTDFAELRKEFEY